MDLDTLIQMLEEIRMELGTGSGMILIPSQTGGDYTPSSAYEFNDDIHIN